MSTTDRRYPQGTADLVAVSITLADGTIPAAGIVSVATTAPTAVPASGAFSAATSIGSVYGKLLAGTEPTGTYRLWAKVAAAGETPLYDCGLFYITTPADDINRGVWPIDPTTQVGLVRLATGDTDASNIAAGAGSYAWFSDASITALIGLNSNSPIRTAIYILRLVSMTPALILKKWASADLSVDGAAITQALKVAIDGLEKSIALGEAEANASFFAIVNTGPTQAQNPYWAEPWREQLAGYGIDNTIPYIV